MSVIEDLIAKNASFAKAFPHSDLPVSPARHLAIVTCMDSRIDVFAALGLEIGEAHVLRNAGGIVTEDMVRSLVISQRLLSTRSIMVIQHTNCGMLNFTDEELAGEIEADAGARPPFVLGAFRDLDERVAESVRSLKKSPFLPYTDDVRGFVYDVANGELREVQTST